MASGFGRADPEVGRAPVAAGRRPRRVQPPLPQQPPGRIAGGKGAVGGRVRQPRDPRRSVARGRRSLGGGGLGDLVREQIGDMGLRLVIEARDERIEGGVRLDLGGVDEELFAPDQPCLLARIHHLLEEALEDVDAQALPDAGQAGVVGKVLAEGVAEIPAVRQVEAGGFDQLAFGADALEEHHELELEEDDRIDARPAALGIQVAHPVAHEAQIERRL